MLAHPLLPQPAALLGISVCPGISPTKRAQIPLEDSLQVLHAAKHGAGFLRKTVKATSLNSSEEQGATSGSRAAKPIGGDKGKQQLH